MSSERNRPPRRLGLIGEPDGRSLNAYRRALHDRLSARNAVPAELLVEVTVPGIGGLLAHEKWWTVVEILRVRVQAAVRQGAAAFLLASLDLHHLADEIATAAPIPLLHPVPALARTLLQSGRTTRPPGLLASGFAIGRGPILRELSRRIGRTVLIPGPDDAATLEGLASATGDDARVSLLRIMHRLRMAGAGPLVLGLPQLEEILGPDDLGGNCLSLARIHAEAAADWLLWHGQRGT